MPQPQDPQHELERLAVRPEPGIVREFLAFLRTNKKWWLAPIIVAILLIGLLVILHTAAPPFIYPL